MNVGGVDKVVDSSTDLVSFRSKYFISHIRISSQEAQQRGFDIEYQSA